MEHRIAVRVSLVAAHCIRSDCVDSLQCARRAAVQQGQQHGRGRPPARASTASQGPAVAVDELVGSSSTAPPRGRRRVQAARCPDSRNSIQPLLEARRVDSVLMGASNGRSTDTDQSIRPAASGSGGQFGWILVPGPRRGRGAGAGSTPSAAARTPREGHAEAMPVR